MGGLPQLNGRQRIFNEPCSAFGQVFLWRFRLRQTLDGTVLCRHFHEQPPYSKRCTQAKRLSTTKGQRKEGLSAESTDMPSAHLAVQVADHEFRPAIVVGHVFAGIGVDGFQILGKEAVEITVQLCHIHRNVYCRS